MLMFRYYIAALFASLLCLGSFELLADDRISEIRFEGNNKTRLSILNQELLIKVGDPLNKELVEKSRQNIMDLGLFKSVRFRTESGGIVVFVIKEKRYLLLLPRFSRDKKRTAPTHPDCLRYVAGQKRRRQMRMSQSRIPVNWISA